MMNRYVKIVIGELLIVCLLAGMLTGCGGASKENETTVPEEVTAQEDIATEESLTKVPEETTEEETEAFAGPIFKINWLDVEFALDVITGYWRNDTAMYIRGKNQVGNRSNWKEQVICCNPDGTNQKVVLNIPTKEEQYDSDVYRTYQVMNVDAKGNLFTVYRDYIQVNKNTCCLEKLDSNGEVLWTVAFPANVYEVNSTVMIGEQLVCAVRTLREGGAYDKTLVLVYDSEGNLLKQYDTGSKMPMSAMTYGGKLYLMEQGGLPQFTYFRYREFNLETGEPGEEFADGLEWYGTRIGSGCGYELLVQDYEGIWGYHLEGVSCVKVLDFELSGLDPQMDAIILPYGEDEFLLIVKDLKASGWAKSSMAILTRATWEDLKDK